MSGVYTFAKSFFATETFIPVQGPVSRKQVTGQEARTPTLYIVPEIHYMVITPILNTKITL